MNEHMMTEYVRTRHADLISEAAAERTATHHSRRTLSPQPDQEPRATPSRATTSGAITSRATTSGATATGATASGATHGLRHRAARALHTLANAIDPHPTAH
ncbi:hypothetical protein ACIBKY_39830 [Nonomuraea sp. NPDC050394]|uniref:hypothetical protein n=1 Tax=Nonomuraea sp. NPDC050394 TaxID=3364363 RepID=UPI0037B0F93C